jgi:hypothetical protein
VRARDFLQAHQTLLRAFDRAEVLIRLLNCAIVKTGHAILDSAEQTLLGLIS